MGTQSRISKPSAPATEEKKEQKSNLNRNRKQSPEDFEKIESYNKRQKNKRKQNPEQKNSQKSNLNKETNTIAALLAVWKLDTWMLRHVMPFHGLL